MDIPATVPGEETRDTTRTMANLLGDLRAAGETVEEAAKPGSFYVGDGLPPVPARMVTKIGKWEFVEMYELLPEFWTQKGEEASPKNSSRAKAKKRTQDISVWLQCFALYVSVMASRSPEHVPELMAYMVSILRASQEYDGSAWTSYDAAYRRQAAATGHKKWSKVNPSLYTVCFTGKARKAARCDLCLSAAHKSEECHLAGDDDPDMARRIRAVESAVVAFSSGSHGSQPARAFLSGEVCRLFNEKRCRFRNCKYRHVCRICEGAHAALDCPRQGGQSGNAGPGPTRRENPPRYHGTGYPY